MGLPLSCSLRIYNIISHLACCQFDLGPGSDRYYIYIYIFCPTLYVVVNLQVGQWNPMNVFYRVRPHGTRMAGATSYLCLVFLLRRHWMLIGCAIVPTTRTELVGLLANYIRLIAWFPGSNTAFSLDR